MATEQPERFMPTWLEHDDRTAARLPLTLTVVLSGPRTDSTIVKLLDVSSLGCRIGLCESRVTVGAYISIEIPGYTAVEGWIAWTGNKQAGVDFAHPLPPPMVAYLVMLGANECAPLR